MQENQSFIKLQISEKKQSDEGKDFLKLNKISLQNFASKTIWSKNE